eukprot:14686608-Ditylum_brightwellii.AAC.1
MWTEIKDDGLENNESIWVMLLEIENHMGLGSLIHWNGFVSTQMGHIVEVGFDFLQGLFIGDDSRAELFHTVGKISSSQRSGFVGLLVDVVK